MGENSHSGMHPVCVCQNVKLLVSVIPGNFEEVYAAFMFWLSRQNQLNIFNRIFYKQWIWFSWKYFLQTVDVYGSYYFGESLFNCWRIYCKNCWWCLWSLPSSFHCKSKSKTFKNSRRKLIWKWINYISDVSRKFGSRYTGLGTPTLVPKKGFLTFYLKIFFKHPQRRVFCYSIYVI